MGRFVSENSTEFLIRDKTGFCPDKGKNTVFYRKTDSGEKAVFLLDSTNGNVEFRDHKGDSLVTMESTGKVLIKGADILAKLNTLEEEFIERITRQEAAAKELKKSLDSSNQSIDELTAQLEIVDFPFAFDGKGARVIKKGKEYEPVPVKIEHIKFRGNKFLATLSFSYYFGKESESGGLIIPLPEKFYFSDVITKTNGMSVILSKKQDYFTFSSENGSGFIEILFYN